MTNVYLDKESLDALITDRTTLKVFKGLEEAYRMAEINTDKYEENRQKNECDKTAYGWIEVVHPQYKIEYQMIWENMKGD